MTNLRIDVARLYLCGKMSFEFIGTLGSCTLSSVEFFLFCFSEKCCGSMPTFPGKGWCYPVGGGVMSGWQDVVFPMRDNVASFKAHRTHFPIGFGERSNSENSSKPRDRKKEKPAWV